MTAKSLMLVGTASDVGKSIIATGLCRIFVQDGWRVSPFKSQNMTLNSFITLDGKEIGHSQAIQAAAAKVEPTVAMNPILLKPTGEMRSQVILLGKPLAEMSAREYRANYVMNTIPVLKEALATLKDQSDIIVMEGAGSPVEINLKDRDIVNMRAAALANASVVLIADIDRGGVFASICGTLDLLTPTERAMVKGIIINKFRGDLSLFADGVEWLTKHTGKPVLGVVPHLPDIDIDAEDSLALAASPHGYGLFADLQIAVLHLPRIRNFKDLAALQHEPRTSVYFVSHASQLGSPDLVILPSSQNMIEDLAYMHQSGLAAKLNLYHQSGGHIIGLGSGYQMLGQEIRLPKESKSKESRSTLGLGLLDVTASVLDQAQRYRSLAISRGALPFEEEGERLIGQEELFCKTKLGKDAMPWLQIEQRFRTPVTVADGAISANGRCWGTNLHGIFDNNIWRRKLIDWLRQQKGIPKLNAPVYDSKQGTEAAFDRLAAHLRQHLDLRKLYDILELRS